MGKPDVLEVELDAKGTDVYFKPLDRTLRGRLDFADVANADKQRRLWGGPIPGMIVGVDVTKGEGFIKEPVHGNEKMKELAEKEFTLAPELETFPDVDVPKWLRAIGRLIQSGFARVIRGEPPEVEPEVQEPTAVELLAAAMYAGLTPQQKADADARLAALRR